MYAYLYIKHFNMCVQNNPLIYVCIYVYPLMCYVCIHYICFIVCTYITPLSNACVYMYTRVYLRLYACTHVYTCIRALLCKCMCVKGSCWVGTAILPILQTGTPLAEGPCLLGGDLGVHQGPHPPPQPAETALYLSRWAALMGQYINR